MKLNLEQKKSLSNYLGNMSIAWFAGGIIGPLVSRQSYKEIGILIIVSLLISLIFLQSMLILLKGRKRKK